MRGLELRHEDVFPPAFRHLSGIGRLDEERDGFLQVLQGILDRGALPGYSSAPRCAVASLSTQSASSHVTPLRPGTLRRAPAR